MKVLLSPSLLSANLSAMAAEARKIEAAGLKWLHLDVMDGSFVPNITFGPPVIKSLRKACGLFFDVHLMIEEPARYVEAFADAGANLLVPHIEAMSHPQRTLALIRQCGLKAGVALDPDTDFTRLRWLLPDIDMVLIMGVNPGFSGQKFIPQAMEKIGACRQYLGRHGYGHLPVEVDGGATPQRAAALVGAGASILVSGSAFFGYEDYGQARRAFEDACALLHHDEDVARACSEADAWAQLAQN